MVAMIEVRNHILESAEKLMFMGTEIKSPLQNAVPLATATLSDRVIVIYQPRGRKYESLPIANAFAFDRDGNILFEVEQHGLPSSIFSDHNSSFSLDGERLVIGTSLGGQAYLDTNTGKIDRLGGRPW